MSTANVQADYGKRAARPLIDEEALRRTAVVEAGVEPRPIDTALMHADDRLGRLEAVLEGTLVAAINALEVRLDAVLTPGATDPGPTKPDDATADPSPAPYTSTVARRITSLADRADNAADRLLAAIGRLEVITAGVEA